MKMLFAIVLLSLATQAQADIIPSDGPEVLNTFELSYVRVSYGVEVMLKRANDGNSVTLGAVEGSQSNGVAEPSHSLR